MCCWCKSLPESDLVCWSYANVHRCSSICNIILVTEIFCYRYSTINNSARKYNFSTKFGDSYRNLLGIKCTKIYSDSFRFDIFIVRSLWGQFFYQTQCICIVDQICHWFARLCFVAVFRRSCDLKPVNSIMYRSNHVPLRDG